MKKTAMVLGGILTLTLAANIFAETTNVYSKNAVGYINLNLPANFTLVGMQLQGNNNAALSIDQMFGTNMPHGTTLYFYTPPVGPYKTFYYFNGLSWVDDELEPAGATPVQRTEGLWVYLPTPTNVSVVGEVPSTNSTSIPVVNGFRLISFPYPAPQSLTNSAFASQAVDGDMIYAWNGNGYTTYYFISGQWVDDELAPSTLILTPGKGYWYFSNSARNLDQTKPYQWP